MSSWEMNYANDKEVFTDMESTLLDFVALMSIREKHVVVWNLEDEDPSDVEISFLGILSRFQNRCLKSSMMKTIFVSPHLQWMVKMD